jgi:hypothetical protein
MEEPYLLPEVTKLNPWVSMATPVRWTCSSTYQLIKEDFPAEWFPEGVLLICHYITDRVLDPA